jgi:hypothetical protein
VNAAVRSVAASFGDRLEHLVGQAVLMLVALMLAMLGVISLAVAACVALAQVWGVPLAALATGATLIVLALVAWLVARDGRARSGSGDQRDFDSATPVTAGAAELGAALASGIQGRPKEAALIALVTGMVAGASPGLRRRLDRLLD